MGGGGTVLQGWDLSQKHAAFPTRCQLADSRGPAPTRALRSRGAKSPSALRAQGSGSRCQLSAPDGNSAIVFATDPTPAVLLPIPHCRKSISGFLIQRDLEIFCCGNLLPFITDLTPAVLLSHPVLKKIHQRLSYLVELRDFLLW